MPYKLNNYEIDGTWSHHQSIILDVILDRIFKIAYQQFKSPPLSWRSKKTIEVVERLSGGTVNPAIISQINSMPTEAYSQKIKLFYADYPVSLNPIKLFETYPVLKPYRYSFTEQLKRIAQTKFRMTYKVKYMHQKPAFDEKGKLTDSGQLIDLNYQMNEFQQLFEIVTVRKDEIILNFKSPLGKLIIHNMLILDTDWCPVEAMSLKKNAYFLYKGFILNKLAGKHKSKTLELKFDDLKEFLDLKWSNPNGVHAIIRKAFDSMVQNKIIAEYKKSSKNRFKKFNYKLYFEDAAEGIKEERKILKFKAQG
jgi:hypothetical protein